ncbi:unnamed protein product [Phyllotreta striolata]|uniref:UBC core domain-containing protein n=1 Tax=Phyllotreta striolata TaxID=444603 RepID=A0A9N9TTC0_PHYSR|nr:unnamed protein product [Phyllotreta striolata]
MSNFQREGSIRKVLPVERNEDLLQETRENDIQKLYKTYKQEYVILAEYKMVQNENVPGVYVIPSKESSLLWFGVVFVRNGHYKDGVFRFNIFLDENFPDSEHPKVIFYSKLFHPVINPETNELNLLKAFPKWCKASQHIWQVVKFIQWIFYDMDKSVEHAVNLEAAEMFKNDTENFQKLAAEIVKESKNRLYDEPPVDDEHYLKFEPYVPDIHDKVRSEMINGQFETKYSKKGLSWVLPGSKKALTRPPTPPVEESEL